VIRGARSLYESYFYLLCYQHSARNCCAMAGGRDTKRRSVSRETLCRLYCTYIYVHTMATCPTNKTGYGAPGQRPERHESLRQAQGRWWGSRFFLSFLLCQRLITYVPLLRSGPTQAELPPHHAKSARDGGPGFHPITRKARVMGGPAWVGHPPVLGRIRVGQTRIDSSFSPLFILFFSSCSMTRSD
jgi:hypothetical protein